MKKLNFKKLTTLPKGKYHDGNGLYITISKTGSGKWSFRYRINQKSREMGLGKFPEVSLAEARLSTLNHAGHVEVAFVGALVDLEVAGLL